MAKGVHSHWVDGRLVDARPVPDSPWGRILAVVFLLLVFDFALAQVPAAAQDVLAERGPTTAAELRRTLADAVASEGRPILLVGDSVLAGDVLAPHRPDDWREHRVVEYMSRELAAPAQLGVHDPGVSFHQIALDGLLPVDALHVLAELDRLDPGGRVEFVFELNLRYFSDQYADQRDCTRPAVCDLAVAAGAEGGRPLIRSWQGLVEAAGGARDWLGARVPVLRRRARLESTRLDEIPGLVNRRDGQGSDPADAGPRDQADESVEQADELSDLGQGEVEARARVREHYRSAAIRAANEQRRALAEILDRLDARGRTGTLFWTPLEDRFADSALTEETLGRRYVAVAAMVNDHQNPKLNLISLDHPLFGDALFIDHVHLWPEGARLLAINLIHELGLALRHRPFEEMMVHPEGFDRSLVHRTGQGYTEGGAWQARLDDPEGVAVDRRGTRVVIADTKNHVLRELRGNMQFVESVAGKAHKPGPEDGWARVDARLDEPRFPELLGDAVWFIDGAERERVRVLDDDFVRTPSWVGPRCDGYQRLRTDTGTDSGEAEHGPSVWMLCDDSRVLRLDLDAGVAEEVVTSLRRSERGHGLAKRDLVAFELAPDTVYFADAAGRLWSRTRDAGAKLGAKLGPWELVFASAGPDLLPNGRRTGFPYHYDDLRMAKVLDLRFVERYGGLLVADEFPPNTNSQRLAREWTERVHLRYFDLDAERVLPWIKALPHGEAHVLWNESVDQFASYWHLGSMALVQDDASLIWVEQGRSRVLRVADGLLGAAKTGNHHTRAVTVPILMTIALVARKIEAELRPDRYLDLRHEPLPRRGPYVGALFGSSLSSMSDRYSNYSLGRRLELELQRELGYRHGIRLDLFQVSWPAGSFGENVNNFANWMATSVPPDVVFIEAHDFGGGYLRDMKEEGAVAEAFAKLQRFAERYDTLVVFYDLSSVESNRREGMRSTDKNVREVLASAAGLGFVVLDPGDRLFPQLLMHSPWGNQPFDDNQHHPATWTADITAQTLAAMVAPILAARFEGRTPVRLAERPPVEFDREEGSRKPLRPALDKVAIDQSALPEVDMAYVQTNYVNRELQIYVDLAGSRDALESRNLNLLAVAVLDKVLREDVYADLAQTVSLEFVEFSNYDEYGNGVVASASSVWSRKLDSGELRNFLVKHAPKP